MTRLFAKPMTRSRRKSRHGRFAKCPYRHEPCVKPASAYHALGEIPDFWCDRDMRATFRSFAGLSFATGSVASCSSVGKRMATAVEYPDGGFPMDCPWPGETWRLLAAKAGVPRRRAPPLREIRDNRT
jgi:hypothetical protein